MVKKFTLMFLLGIFGLFSTNLFAQEDATIDPSQIKFCPVSDENCFIFTLANPEFDVGWVDCRIFLCEKVGREKTENS